MLADIRAPLSLILLLGAGAACVSASSASPAEAYPMLGDLNLSAHVPIAAGTFSVYPGYVGNLVASGSVQIGQAGADTQVLFFSLEGTDPQCNVSADVSGVANACGIHVHEGVSCEDAGGHYFDSTVVSEDPWKLVRYTVADSNGTSSGQNVRVTTGKRLVDVVGRSLVIHDVTGARIACAALEATAGQAHGTPMVVDSFTKYPGYTGSLVTTGSATIFGTGMDASQVVSFSLSGVDPACGGTPSLRGASAGGVPNACGIHVHEGSDCTDAATIGGHFYDDSNNRSDPWAPIMYSTANGDAGGVTIQVVTGVSTAEVLGRTLVVHDAAGKRIACGQIGKMVANPGKQTPLEVAVFSTYPGYMGNLAVSGSVQIGQDGDDTQVLFFNLEGADPQCTSTAAIESVSNACGIHVHSGLSCAAAGGHYYDSTMEDDPWALVRYTTAGGTGAASGQNMRVVTGKSLADVEGRTMVIHDVNGDRIACALLSGSSFQGSALVVESFVAYPGYSGNLTTAGNMTILQVGTGSEASQVLSFTLVGADPTCGTANTSGVQNACGIHVHEGSSCSDADTIGGHYWDSANITADPWKPIMYTAQSGEASGVTIAVHTGTAGSDIVGRSLVVHDATGARIACGQIAHLDDSSSQSAKPMQVHSGARLEVLSSVLAFALLFAQML